MNEFAIAPAVETALIIAREHGRVASIDSMLRTELARGTIVRLRRGLYAHRERWAALSATERYHAFVIGVARSIDAVPVLSHESAAVLHGLPRVEPWPAAVHELVERSAGGRSAPGRRRHALGIDDRDVILRGGLLLTTVERTVVDIAATSSTFSAVAAIDAALHADRWRRRPALTSRDAVIEVWERMLPFRGSARARQLIEFGDGLAGSVHESNSRVTMARLGMPTPQLQRVWLIDGVEYDTDFYFPAEDCIGEADGKVKYEDVRILAGRTPQEVLYGEKRREDALRRRSHGFARWDYAVGMSMPALGARLAEVGVLPVCAPRFRAGRISAE